MKLYEHKVCKSIAFVRPETLPPTPTAMKYHSLRVYLQIMQWRGLFLQMRPEDWAWRISKGMYVPVITDIKAASDNVLKVISCNCNGICAHLRCPCKKYRLFCTSVCGKYREVDCDNNEKTSDIDQYDDDSFKLKPQLQLYVISNSINLVTLLI